MFLKKKSSPPPNPSHHRKNAEGNHHSSGWPMRESDRHGVLEATLPRTWYQQRRHPRRLRHSGSISNLHFCFALSKHPAFILRLTPSDLRLTGNVRQLLVGVSTPWICVSQDVRYLPNFSIFAFISLLQGPPLVSVELLLILDLGIVSFFLLWRRHISIFLFFPLLLRYF